MHLYYATGLNYIFFPRNHEPAHEEKAHSVLPWVPIHSLTQEMTLLNRENDISVSLDRVDRGGSRIE